MRMGKKNYDFSTRKRLRRKFKKNSSRVSDDIESIEKTSDSLPNSSNECAAHIERRLRHPEPHRGMAASIMPEKKVFRARVLDPNKRLDVRILPKCSSPHLQQSPKIKRAVAVPPSGMEKEEEMESHLQQAIYAQKATSAGVSVENHVIPTPKVFAIDRAEYQKTYRLKAFRSKKLNVFKDFVSFFLNQSVYDADSEDEEWLSTKENICINHFEEIIVKLENASQSADAIIHPMEAKALLQRYDSQTVDDVYDYWLQKRKQAALTGSKYGSVLIPKLNTDGNIFRRDEKTTINPYIAFRKRLDKVQTRKKQKTEIQTYEKILRLNYALKRSIALMESVKLREKTKLALVYYNDAILAKQYEIGDEYNRELERISSLYQPNFRVPDLPQVNNTIAMTDLETTIAALKKRSVQGNLLENGGKSSSLPNVFKTKNSTNNNNISFSPSNFLQNSKRRNRFNRNNKVGILDADPLSIASDVWLKRNLELWNRITPTACSKALPMNSTTLNNVVGSPGIYSLLEAQKLAKIDINSSVDGNYQFNRKVGCKYRAANALLSSCVERFPEAVSASFLANAWKTMAKDHQAELGEGTEDLSYFMIKLDPASDLFAIKPSIMSSNQRTTNLYRGVYREPETFFNANSFQTRYKFSKEEEEKVRFARRRFGRGGRVIFDLNF